MRIGLDIDNVITDFDKSILEEFIKEDKNKRNSGINVCLMRLNIIKYI